MKSHNFGAGPAVLPPEVFKQASKAILQYKNTGLSILEIPHRSHFFLEIITEAQQLVLELLHLKNKGYKVLFLQGGARMEFARIPYNLLTSSKKAAYLDTGTWASKAIEEAKKIGEISIVGSSKDKNYKYIPKKYTIPAAASYFHCTSNNTIFGTQIKKFPTTNVPVVCDMSSDIFSRNINYSQFDLIYAGVQKNIGTAGATLVVVKESILSEENTTIPRILNYKEHIKANSIYNTPPIFSIYTSLLTLRWLKENGGVQEIEKKNKEKATLLYNEIDENPYFIGAANKEDRSLMNVTFQLVDTANTAKFIALCEKENIVGLQGHRSVGGYRASLYNALSLSSVQTLVTVMKKMKE